jgi:hypothetical protein
MLTPYPTNESSNSIELYFLSGRFIKHLNQHAPTNKMLRGFEWIVDLANPKTSTTSQAFLLLLRPNFQLFMRDLLIHILENRIDKVDLNEGKEKNASKLKLWSPFYYGTLLYVIGGCYIGRQFQ